MIFPRVVLSAIGAIVYVLVVGFLEIRAAAVENGTIIDWNNTLTAVTPPESPWLQSAALAAVSAVAVYAVWPRASRDPGTRVVLPAAAMAVTLIAVAAWFLVTTDFPYSPFESVIATSDSHSPVIEWARAGALSSATYGLAGVSSVIAFMGKDVTKNRVEDQTIPT